MITLATLLKTNFIEHCLAHFSCVNVSISCIVLRTMSYKQMAIYMYVLNTIRWMLLEIQNIACWWSSSDVNRSLWSECISNREPNFVQTFHLPLSSKGHRTGSLSFQKETEKLSSKHIYWNVTQTVIIAQGSREALSFAAEDCGSWQHGDQALRKKTEKI